MSEKLKELLSKMNFWQLLLILVAGFVLVFLSLPKKEESEPVQQNSTLSELTESSYEEKLERKLEEMLSQVEGIGEVEVVITIKASGEIVLNKDVRTNSSSSNESEQDGSSRISNSEEYEEDTILTGEIPYVIQEYSPVIEGILVIAEGGGSAEIQEEINNALTALFDIAPHKIKVLKKKAGDVSGK
ncbi:MAG: stage III sporulation protein AG [Lachnospiraceae bacterium]